jgi:hypothetical protein
VLSDAEASIAIEIIRTKLNSRIKERHLPMRLNTTNIAPTNIAMGDAEVWEAVSVTLAEIMADSGHYSIDSTTVRAHVSAAGGKSRQV